MEIRVSGSCLRHDSGEGGDEARRVEHAWDGRRLLRRRLLLLLRRRLLRRLLLRGESGCVRAARGQLVELLEVALLLEDAVGNAEGLCHGCRRARSAACRP